MLLPALLLPLQQVRLLTVPVAQRDSKTLASILKLTKNLADDFFSTIEEVGLTDIAKEIGMDLGPRGDDSGAPFVYMGAQSGESSGAIPYDASQYSNGSCVASSPPRVHMPQCSW